MRIAFVSTILDHAWGGADTLWTRAAEAAVARGDEVLLAVSAIVAEHPRVAAMLGHGAKLQLRAAPGTVSLAGRVARKAARTLGRNRDRLITELDAFRPDLVILSGGGTYDLLLEPSLSQWLRATAQRFRMVANWQTENPLLSSVDLETMQTILPLADGLFFVSHRNLAATRRHLLRPLANARVVHNPLRCGSGATLPWPADETLRFATVGRLHGTKGIALLLHALHATLGQTSGWHLHIIGRGSEEEYLHTTTALLGLESRVTFEGQIESLVGIWAQRHLLISSPLEEGVPMTIPEAMLHGRPVLATSVGGAEDWITDEVNGYLCPAPTLPLLSATLARAWAGRADWHQLGARAATAAAAAYRPDDYLQLIAPVTPDRLP